MILNPALLAAIGSIGGGILSRWNYIRDRNYNNPYSQLKRFAQTGLPMAAFTPNHATEQPNADYGLANAGMHIGKYAQVEKEIQENINLKEDLRGKKNLNDIGQATRNHLLDRSGRDSSNTNLSRNMETLYRIDKANASMKDFESKIKGKENENTRTKLGLENSKMMAEIGNLWKENQMKSEQITGQQLANKITAIVARYQPKLNEANLKKIGAEITKMGVDTDIAKVARTVARETEGYQISKSQLDLWKENLSYDSMKEYFDTYTQYQDFRKKADKIFGDKYLSPAEMAQSLAALVKVTISDVTGQTGNVLKMLK